MPRLALSTVHLAVREYWTAAAALIGLCILGECSLSTLLPRPTLVRGETASLSRDLFTCARVLEPAFRIQCTSRGAALAASRGSKCRLLATCIPSPLPPGLGQRDGRPHLAHLGSATHLALSSQFTSHGY